jgi:AraC family transcriptional regulator
MQCAFVSKKCFFFWSSPRRYNRSMLESILSPVILGPATLIRSSSALRWQSLLLEKYSCSPGERPEEKPLDQHVLVMLCSPTWRGEKKAADGTFVPASKAVGALTTVPRGPVPFGRSFEKADILYCAFGDPLLSAVREELDGRLPLPVSPRSGLHDHAVSEILHLLFAEVESGGASGTLYAESLAHALAVRFLFLGEYLPTRSSATAVLPQRKLRGIQDLIESRLDADLTLQELAAAIGYSRSHFLRMFRATTGMTPHRYVLKRRVERARQLLEQVGLSIAEVAMICGFSSQAHLTFAFRKEYGITPTEYRRHL